MSDYRLPALNLAPDADWRKRFRLPIVLYTQPARMNPARGLAVTNKTGVYQIHAWDVLTSELRQITDAPTGRAFGGISPDGSHLYYFQDEQGNEIGHFVRVPFNATLETPAEDLTPDLPPYSSFSLSQSLSGRVIGFTAGDSEGIKMYTITLSEGDKLTPPQLLYKASKFAVGPLLSFDGDYAVIATTEPSQYTNMTLMAFQLGSQDAAQKVLVLGEADDEGSISPVSFAPLPGDTRLLATTNVTGFDRPLIWDVKTGDRTDIPLLGMEGEFAAVDWSPDGKRILLLQLVQAKLQLYIYDLENSTLHKLNHKPGVYTSGYFYSNDEIYINWQDAVSPSRVVALDAQTGEQKRVVLDVGEAPQGQPFRSITFPSSGGQMIQAWLATPPGDGPFPTILHTHGGPTAVMTDYFNASAQAWLDHGFAFISVNYRGSTTFGRDFEQAINGRLGELEIDDMAAARDYVVRHGIAHPEAILLEGGSYGGYLTLQAIGKRPELWSGGMAMVAIADWRLMYEDQAEMLRGYQRSLFGGTPDELPEQHAASSPITYADEIRAPLLIIQGRNDTRCPSRQMEAYVETLNTKGKAVQISWFDAGHGSLDIEKNIEHQELMLRWAYQVLG